MMSARKKRRESGRTYNKFFDPDNGFYNEQYWDDWTDYRDGMRNIHRDNTLLKSDDVKARVVDNRVVDNRNKKLLKLLKRRRAMKNHPRHSTT